MSNPQVIANDVPTRTGPHVLRGATVVEMSASWDNYPLAAKLVPTQRRFHIGPFEGRCVRGKITLRVRGSTTGESWALASGDAVTVSLEHVIYRLRVSEMLPRLPRLTLPGWPLAIAAAVATLLVAGGLIIALLSVPALDPMVLLSTDDTLEIPMPARSSERAPAWASAVGVVPETICGGLYDKPTIGEAVDDKDCRVGPLPPCPRDIQALSLIDALRELPDVPDLAVEGRVGTNEEGYTVLLPVTTNKMTARSYRTLLEQRTEGYYRGLQECASAFIGLRVIVRARVLPDIVLFWDMCAVVPGTEPSRTRPLRGRFGRSG